ncbi:hypothetical protein [Actinoallomurus sp. CA-150999]|uniref:hypothetical protein n=1 Tax=Actinoallomurus sp. CA-150999 TaxID=3239887 RepID=UPI003D94384F
MTDDGIKIQSGSLRRAASDLHRAGESLDKEWKSFQAQAKDLKYGSTDMVGSLIGASYEAVISWAHTSYDSAVKAFVSFGKAVDVMAARYDGAENAGVAAAKRVGEDL